MTVAAGTGGASQRAFRALGPLLEEVQETFLGEHLHVVLAAAPAEDAALIRARPGEAFFLQLSQTPLSCCFLQLTFRVVLREREMKALTLTFIESFSVPLS